jgi:hypothetical protein
LGISVVREAGRQRGRSRNESERIGRERAEIKEKGFGFGCSGLDKTRSVILEKNKQLL